KNSQSSTCCCLPSAGIKVTSDSEPADLGARDWALSSSGQYELLTLRQGSRNPAP
ncbi:hypothetical protein LEMLEM_LOCUS1983, partial [Lemmus lemmus]